MIEKYFGIDSYEEFWRIIEDSDENYIKTIFDITNGEYIKRVANLIENINQNKSAYDEVKARMSGSGHSPPMGGCQGSFAAGLIEDRYNEAVKNFIRTTEPVIMNKSRQIYVAFLKISPDS